MRFHYCKVGSESKSGLAVHVEIDGEEYWVPLSLVSYIRRDPRVMYQDEIEIEDWWCRKEGLEA